MMWFRAAELKHGRVAMLASVGYLVGAAGITFPGEIAKGVTFASVNADGVYNAWGSVPGRIDPLPFDRAAGTSGLWAPKIRFWDPLNFTGALSADQKARKRKAELKNGRLAMTGIVSFLIGHNLPGSVPALNSAF